MAGKRNTNSKAKNNAVTDAMTAADINNMAIQTENVRNVLNLFTNEFSSLTGQNIHFYLECKRKGVNFWAALLFDEIRRRDLRIGAVCQTRKLGVVKKEWELSFPTDSSVPQTQQDEVIKLIKDVFARIGLINFMTDCVEASLQGISAFELIWTLYGKYTIPDKINYIQNHMICYDDKANQYRYLNAESCDAQKLRLLGWTTLKDRIDLTGLTVDDIHPMKLLEVRSLDGNSPNGFMNGCHDALVWAYLFKNYGLKDWARWIEKFATPSIVGKEGTLMGTATKTAYFNALKNWGNSNVLLLPQGAEVDTLGDKNIAGTKDAFNSFTNYWNTEIAIRVLGQSLTTGSGDGKGSYALGKVHDQVREDYLIADMMMIKDAVNEVINRVLIVNFPNLAEKPGFSFVDEINIEYKKTRSEIMKNVREIGYIVKQEEVEEEFDIEVDPAPAAQPTPPHGAAGFVQTFIDELEIIE
jgi:phage gp29-like protein